MKMDSRFHCFGCGADGDVIDFTAKLFQLSLLQAAEKLAADFGLSATDNFQPLPCKPVEKPLSPKEQFYKILCGYRSLLANWRMAYAPKNPEASLHPCFVASLHYADRVQYLLDILLLGSLPEKQQLLNGKEVTALGKAIERCKETEEAAKRTRPKLGGRQRENNRTVVCRLLFEPAPHALLSRQTVHPGWHGGR